MSRQGPTRLAIRPGVAADLPALNAVYNHYVTETPATFDITPITPPQRERWFRDFDGRGPHRLLVADARDGFLGFACSRELRPKEAYATSVETTVYVARDAQGRGIGGRLYTALLRALESENVHRAYAAITLPNAPSVALHEKLGFRPIGTWNEVGKKFGRYWSVAWYAKNLP